MKRRTSLVLFVLLAVLAATMAPASAQERRACGNIVPHGYNLIVSDARFIIGTPGRDFICAGNSKNTIRAKGGADAIYANGGNDVIYGGYGADEIYAGRGADRVIAGGGKDLVFGDDGNDVILGGQGWDEIWGQNGDDRITGGSGDDKLHGADGNDRLIGNQGKDILKGWAGNDVLWGGVGDDELQGGPGDDILIGGAHDDELDGDEGNDDLRGLDGNDSLVGGEGNNSLVGGPGNDSISFASPGSQNVYAGGPGIDRCPFEQSSSLTYPEEVGCENGNRHVFDPPPAYSFYDVLIVEHHVEGSSEVPNGMVHVRAENLGWGGSPFYDRINAQLVVRKPPYTQDFRTFMEPIGTGRDGQGFFGKSFRKQLSAVTVGQGRLVELQTPGGRPANRLQVHLTGATFNAGSNTLEISGTTGKEVTIVVSDDMNNVLEVIHEPIPANGPIQLHVSALPENFAKVDVMRFDLSGDYEIFPDVVRDVALVHELGSTTVSLTEAPNGSVTDVPVEVYSGTTLVESGVLSAAGNWVVDLAAAPTVGMEIRTTLPAGLVKSLAVAPVNLTDVTGTLAGDPWAAGIAPAGWEVRIEMWDLTLGRQGVLSADDNFRFRAATDVGGVWNTDGYEGNSPPFIDPGIAAELIAVDDDGDRLVVNIEWPGHV